MSAIVDLDCLAYAMKEADSVCIGKCNSCNFVPCSEYGYTPQKIAEIAEKAVKELIEEKSRRKIKIIRNADFYLLADVGVGDEQIKLSYSARHGTVLYIAGMVEGDEDALVCFGVPDGETEGGLCFYGPFLQFELGWCKLLGKRDRAKELKKIMETASKKRGVG